MHCLFGSRYVTEIASIIGVFFVLSVRGVVCGVCLLKDDDYNSDAWLLGCMHTGGTKIFEAALRWGNKLIFIWCFVKEQRGHLGPLGNCC